MLLAPLPLPLRLPARSNWSAMAGCSQGTLPSLFGCTWQPHKSAIVHTPVGLWRFGGASQSSDATPLVVKKIVGSSRSGLAIHRNSVVMAAESNQDNLPTASNVVTVRHADLLNKSSDLAAVLEEGFGPFGLGIIAVSGVPKFSELRKKLLQLSQSLSALPEEVKSKLEDPISKYSFGWSYGKEILESGQPDSLKGSFYANPLYDVPTLDTKLIQRYPAHCRPNLWPAKHLPELEPTFKMLGALMVEVGLLIAYHCDKYISSRNPSFKKGSLERMLSSSYTHKGRLLHYFPNISSDSCEGQDRSKSWCGWHTDHSSLTALTCAMYIKGGVEIPCPDPEAGLYVRTQSDAIIKAVYNVDSIAYQMGEATEILSEGLFHATPHFVKAAQGSIGSGVERNTFAIFMQPHWDEPLKFSTNSEMGNHESQKTFTFGEFSERTISKYY